MLCKMCGIKETESDLCDSCLQEEKEDKFRINAFIHDGHAVYCSLRLVWGDGECTCKRHQNWITPKFTTAEGRNIVNFDCPELHDYEKEERLLHLYCSLNRGL